MRMLSHPVGVWRGFRQHGARVTVRGVMRRLGIRTCHFYWTRETLAAELPDSVMALPDGHSVCSLNLNEVKALALTAQLHELDSEHVSRAFERGDGCIGIKSGDNILAVASWSLDVTHSNVWPAPLKSNEAYLHSMYVSPASRGQNLASILRHRCYQDLHLLGRDTFYSITLTNNAASQRFKEKLGARKLFRAVYLKVGSREWRMILRRYSR